jgi:hypothetical protein
MGFWTIGPVAGSLITSLIAVHTLNHFGQTHWKSQFVIAGCAALVVFVISFFGLKDLSPGLRDQLMVSARDQALVEARARGLTDHDLLAASERPWRQIFHWDLIGACVGIAVFLLLYYAAASLFTIYYPVIFHNANGTNFSVTQANGLNTWFWTTDIVGLILVGLLSDALKVRKPFMLLGAVISIVMLVIFLGNATHPHTGYYTLAIEASLIAVGISLVFAPWIASYTESVEAKNPALVATGLALWGWILRLTVGISFIFLPAVITSVNPIVDNLPGGRNRHSRSIGPELRGRAPQDHRVRHGAHGTARHSGQGSGGGGGGRKGSVGANIAAAEKAFGLKGLTELAKYKTQLTTLVEPYIPQLTYISAHESALEQLEKGSAQAPHQWQHWFYVDLAGMVVFIPLIWLTKGRWKPSSARRDAAEHEAAVAEELARLIGEQPISVVGDTPRRPGGHPGATCDDDRMETVLRVAGLIVGISIVCSTALSVFTSLVVPRVTSSRAMRTVARVIGAVNRRILPRLPSYEARDRLMAFVGPLAMITLFVVWLGAFVLGFGLIAWWASGQDIGSALAISGSSVFTLGIATSPGSGSRAIEIVAAGVGLLVIALEIAYLPALYNAFSTRETEVTLLATRSGTPAWGPEILARHHMLQSIDELPPLYADWERWAAAVSESHANYPALIWFRSPVSSRSWLLSLVAVMDSAALFHSVSPSQTPRQARLCLSMGTNCLRSMAGALQIPYDTDPHPHSGNEADP